MINWLNSLNWIDKDASLFKIRVYFVYIDFTLSVNRNARKYHLMQITTHYDEGPIMIWYFLVFLLADSVKLFYIVNA